MEDHLNPSDPAKNVKLHEDAKKHAGGRPRKYPKHWSRARKKRAYRDEQRMKAVNPAVTAEARAVSDLTTPRKAIDSDFIDFSSVHACNHVAKIIFSCEMDYRRAAEILRPRLEIEEYFALMVQMQKDPNLQAALDRLFKSIGIDDDSRNQFVKQIWSWFYGDDKDKSLQASRILAKIFFSDSGEKEVSETLHIEGLDEGLKKMLGPQDPDKPIPENVFLVKGEHE